MHLGNHEINKFILLTGAGFTYTFGGFLANEMWALIFNNPELGKHLQLKELLKNDFDYESIYYKVIEGIGFDEAERRALTDAVFSAYRKLDDKIRNYRSLGIEQLVEIYDVRKFIDRFSGHPEITGKNNTKGIFFTLNQDLLIERYFRDLRLITLYVEQPTIEIYQDKVFDESTSSVKLPSINDIEKTNLLSTSKFFYVKLHGSWNWYSSDSSQKLVVGRDKLKQISDEPVLQKYFELFKNALSGQDVRLFVIGYGFGDEHINRVIADSIMNNDLKLYVLNPLDPGKFKDNLKEKDKDYGEKIWNGLTGYYPYDLSQVFPTNTGETVEYRLIVDSIFTSHSH